MKTKHNITILLSLLLSFTANAKPAYRGIVERIQADGTTVQVQIHGDEHFHYTTDLQGNRLVENNGILEKAPALTDDQITQRRNASRFRLAQQQQEEQGAYLAPRGLVILANFSDVKFKAENNLEAFDSLMNVHGYTYHGVSNSVRDYFIDQSQGKYAPQFDVYGPVTVNHNMSYYGSNDAYGNDKNAEQLITDACKAADQQYDIDFSIYDNDGDDFVDFVFVFYAGYGEADGADENTIWQHMYKLYDYSGIECTIDGKNINLYACGSELAYHNRKRVSNPRDGISTCCHEFSHVCGLPDMYLMTDNYNSTVYTLGSWDIMDNGTSNNYGWTPPSYSAYEKFYCGWLTPVLLNSAADIVLPEQNKYNAAAIITASGQHNLDGAAPSPVTFYMLENRQQEGWDKYLPGHGLLITKIQYSRVSWLYNQINTESKQRIAIQPADGKLSANGDAGDTYPGTSGQKTFNTVEAFPITDITETDGIIRFKVLGGGEEMQLDVDATQQHDFTVKAAANGLIVNGAAEGSQINVYSITGQHIVTTQATATQTFIPVQQHGIYLINLKDTTKPIMF